MDQITFRLKAHLLPASSMYCVREKSRQQFTPTLGSSKAWLGVYPHSFHAALGIISFFAFRKEEE